MPRPLARWTPRFERWKTDCAPLFGEGKAKEAFGQYPWFETEGDPFVRLAQPAAETRFGLVTTGGYSIEGEQAPFTGLPDFSDASPPYRVIPTDTDPARLRIDHRGYDHRFAKEDHNANLPFDRLREMASDGEIGSVADDSVVLMGLIPNVAPLIQETIPEIVARFQSDAVQAALLVPS